MCNHCQHISQWIIYATLLLRLFCLKSHSRPSGLTIYLYIILCSSTHDIFTYIWIYALDCLSQNIPSVDYTETYLAYDEFIRLQTLKFVVPQGEILPLFSMSYNSHNNFSWFACPKGITLHKYIGISIKL